MLVVERPDEGKTHGVQRPIYYLSEVLTPTKQRYPHYQKLAEVVDWALDPMGLAFFGLFDHEYGADHLVCGCYVQQQRLALLWRDQDRRGGEKTLEAFKCIVGFRRPLEFICLA